MALAQRIVSERDAYRWFEDRPARFASETEISDRDMTALSDARQRVGELIDHVAVRLPATADLPDVDTVARWHADLIAAAEHRVVASAGPARSLRITAVNADSAMALEQALDELALVQKADAKARWIAPMW